MGGIERIRRLKSIRRIRPRRFLKCQKRVRILEPGRPRRESSRVNVVREPRRSPWNEEQIHPSVPRDGIEPGRRSVRSCGRQHEAPLDALALLWFEPVKRIGEGSSASCFHETLRAPSRNDLAFLEENHIVRRFRFLEISG